MRPRVIYSSFGAGSGTTVQDVNELMQYYHDGVKDGGFESGIRSAITGLLASPFFLYRSEHVPTGLRPGDTYAITCGEPMGYPGGTNSTTLALALKDRFEASGWNVTEWQEPRWYDGNTSGGASVTAVHQGGLVGCFVGQDADLRVAVTIRCSSPDAAAWRNPPGGHRSSSSSTASGRTSSPR